MSQLINPAIGLANEGYVVEEGDANIYRFAENTVKNSPKAYSLFYPNGKRPSVGTKIIQKNLGHTLTLIRDQGPESFYHGEISHAILAKSSEYHGKIIPSDLSDYQVKERKPLRCQYRVLYFNRPPPFQALPSVRHLLYLNPWNQTRPLMNPLLAYLNA